MTISDGYSTKKLNLYSPTQPLLGSKEITWPHLGDYEEEVEVNSIANLMMIARATFIDKQDEEIVLTNVIQNNYG